MAVPYRESIIPAYLAVHVGLPANSFKFSELPQLKNSGDLTDDDLEQVVSIIEASMHPKKSSSELPATRFLVLMGLNALVDSATYINKAIASKFSMTPTLVFTGSRAPLSHPNSDAGYHLAYGLSEARTKGPGLYIAMHGQTWKLGRVAFDKDQCVFHTRT